MHPDIFPSILWGLSFLLSAFALAVLIRRRLGRSWPSLAALLILELLLSTSLFFVRSHYAYYFYIYWGGSLLQSASRLWVLADALRSIPGASFIPSRARIIILIAAVLMGVGAGAVAWTGEVGWVTELHPSSARLILHSVLLYNRAVSFACLALCVGVLAAVFLLGLGWDRTGSLIACGLGLELSELALRSALFAESSHRLRAAADICDGLTHLFVLLIWILALLREHPAFPTHPPPKAEFPKL